MSYFDYLKKIHTKFGINHDGFPRPLSKEEYLFRIGCMIEEIWEYTEATFEFGNIDINALRDNFLQTLGQYELREDIHTPEVLEQQFDALLDMNIFNLGTAERQGFPVDEGYRRVMNANMKKELAVTGDRSKRGFAIDLIKPEGWKPPVLLDLVERPTGIIVLEGPDGTGKTTLAAKLVDDYNAKYIHATWSPELEKGMDKYLLGNIHTAIAHSKDQLVILDRSWISEFVYSEVFRGGTNFPDLAEQCYNLLNENNAQYIFCIPYFATSIDAYSAHFDKLKESREEMYSTMDECFMAFHGFIFGQGEYKINTKDNKTNFIGRYWPEKEGAISHMKNALLYDMFTDPNYIQLTVNLTERLRGKKDEC